MRPDTQYAHSNGEWVEIVDAINDVFNYSLAFPVAKALAANAPGAKVASFPLPADWPRREGDPRRFAFVWMPAKGEVSLSEKSNIITASGQMKAGDWAQEEGYNLIDATIEDPPNTLNSCQRVLFGMVSRLPWFKSVFQDAPPPWQLNEITRLTDTVNSILKNTSARCLLEEALSPVQAWDDLANQTRFSFDRDAAALSASTPHSAGKAPRPRRV